MAFAKNTDSVAFHAIETVSGRYVDVADPKPESICITDIAWSLSRQARFAGHTMSEEVWSVAQHAVFVEDLLNLAMDRDGNGCQLSDSLNDWMSRKCGTHPVEVTDFLSLDWWMDPSFDPRAVLLGALHHDDSEAYLIDLPSPVKRILPLREPYKKLEGVVTEVIGKALDLPKLTKNEHELIVWADLMALQIEAANLMPSRGRGWSMDLPIMNMIDVHLFPQKVHHWQTAYNDFLSRDDELRYRH